ncbi:MAG: DUF1311 domain-containing protein [Lachnospiraceae bacterium]|nr:DUF1311 domain-containing protein [Lachnospiraceae bacterium]
MKRKKAVTAAVALAGVVLAVSQGNTGVLPACISDAAVLTVQAEDLSGILIVEEENEENESDPLQTEESVVVIGSEETEASEKVSGGEGNEESSEASVTGFVQYDEILQLYLTGLNAGWDASGFDENGLCYLTGYLSSAEEFGYFLMDVDGDGTEELLVGQVSEAEDAYQGMFYDFYTIKEEELVQVTASAERGRFYLCMDGTIACEGSSGAFCSSNAFYTFTGTELELTEAVLYDAWEDEENPYFYSTTDEWEDHSTPISQEEASAILNSHEYLEIPYTALSEVAEKLGVAETVSARKQQAIEEVEAASVEAEAIVDQLDNDSLSQSELNQLSYEMYQIWDDILNVLWGYLKDSLPEEEMAALTEEEIAWITEKESAIAAAGAEFEGGTMQPYVENTTGAEMTKERVYVLLEKLS